MAARDDAVHHGEIIGRSRGGYLCPPGIMDFFLLLTALLCGLTGAGRSAVAHAPAVEASRVVAVAQAIAAPAARVAAPRPDGYVAPAPLALDLGLARGFVLRPVPERRRE
jgi:hypothetical protein